MPELHRIKPRTLKFARELRKPLTPPEQKLWSRLRNRQLGGFKFRRQYPIGNYIADFCCVETRLVIELDGDSHVEQEEYDKKRTQEIVLKGYHEMRFANRDVLQNIEGVLEMILEDCLRWNSPSPQPSPTKGEGAEVIE